MSRIAAWARTAVLAAALAPALSFATVECSRSESYDKMIRQALTIRQNYGWLAELGNSCWKADTKRALEHCFEFGRHDGVLLVAQRLDGRTASATPVLPAELAIQPSGGIALVAGGSLRRLDPRRFELVFRPEGGPVTRLVFTRTPEVYGACMHGER